MEFILEVGFKVLSKDMENGEGKIMKFTRVNGKLTKQMGMVVMIMQMVDGMRVNLRII